LPSSEMSPISVHLYCAMFVKNPVPHNISFRASSADASLPFKLPTTSRVGTIVLKSDLRADDEQLLLFSEKALPFFVGERARQHECAMNTTKRRELKKESNVRQNRVMLSSGSKRLLCLDAYCHSSALIIAGSC
jgi:hypothetical protein